MDAPPVQTMEGGIEVVAPPSVDLLLDAPEGELCPLLFYPDEGLEMPSEPVKEYDDELAKLITDLALTMYALGGVGLAAPQIGVHKRVFVMDIFNNQPAQPGKPPPSQLLVAVNPEVEKVSSETEMAKEGCLSFPGAMNAVERPARVWARGMSRKGRPWALVMSGMLGRVFQHELDHLDGVIFTERMKPWARQKTVEAAEMFRDKVVKDRMRDLAPRPPRPSSATRAKARAKRRGRKGRRK